jgi:hypothetical protein
MSADSSKSSTRDLFALSVSVAVRILFVSKSLLKDILRLRLEKQGSTKSIKDLLEGGTFFPLFCKLMFQLLIMMNKLNICILIVGDSSTLSATSTIGTIFNVCRREK